LQLCQVQDQPAASAQQRQGHRRYYLRKGKRGEVAVDLRQQLLQLRGHPVRQAPCGRSPVQGPCGARPLDRGQAVHPGAIKALPGEHCAETGARQRGLPVPQCLHQGGESRDLFFKGFIILINFALYKTLRIFNIKVFVISIF